MIKKYKISTLFLTAVLMALSFFIFILVQPYCFEFSVIQFGQQQKNNCKYCERSSSSNQTQYKINNHIADKCCTTSCCYLVSEVPGLITINVKPKVKSLYSQAVIRYIDLPKIDCLNIQLITSLNKIRTPKIQNIRIFIQSFIF